jgi:hypothetical protein
MPLTKKTSVATTDIQERWAMPMMVWPLVQPPP